MTQRPSIAWLTRAPDFLLKHRRAVTAGLVVGLTGFAVTAFGIAPLAPDAAELPQRWITEAVQPQGVEAQIDALAGQELVLWRSEVTRGNDSADALLRRLGVADAEAARFLRSDLHARKLLQGRGKLLRSRSDTQGRLIELVARYPAENGELAKTHFSRLTISRDLAGLVSKVEQASLSAEVRLASGTIQSSLFAATDEARLPDSVGSQLAEIFSTEIDFHRELRKGDTFSIVYEGLYADGEPVTWNEGAGRVLAAEFINRGRAYHAVWFGGAGPGKGGYFALDGSSKRRAFLASPMEFSRVTSGFGSRLHPIFNNWRQHRGVDYSAPTGTPVRSVGDGTVEFAGWQNGYGKVIEVRHGNDRATLYAHLSAMSVKKGDRIVQGQHIGAVGNTGWSTGSHLHFEFRIKGAHQDPLQVAKAAETVTLDGASRARFAELAQAMQGQLQIAETMSGVRATSE